MHPSFRSSKQDARGPHSAFLSAALCPLYVSLSPPLLIASFPSALLPHSAPLLFAVFLKLEFGCWLVISGTIVLRTSHNRTRLSQIRANGPFSTEATGKSRQILHVSAFGSDLQKLNMYVSVTTLRMLSEILVPVSGRVVERLLVDHLVAWLCACALRISRLIMWRCYVFVLWKCV